MYAGLEAVFVVLKYPFTPASECQPSLGREITRVLLRALHDLDRFNFAQLRWALPSSTAAYKKWVEAHANTEEIPAHTFTELIGNEGAKLHWVGHKSAKKVILYYHGDFILLCFCIDSRSDYFDGKGGGYVLPLSEFHLTFNSYIRREVRRKSGVDVKIAFLEYSQCSSKM